MDEESLRGAEEDLVAWGLLERGPSGLAWTRRMRGAVMRAAARLAEEERAGRKPEGAPLEVAIGHALREMEGSEAWRAARLHERLLYAVELAALPDTVRRIAGG